MATSKKKKVVAKKVVSTKKAAAAPEATPQGGPMRAHDSTTNQASQKEKSPSPADPLFKEGDIGEYEVGCCPAPRPPATTEKTVARSLPAKKVAAKKKARADALLLFVNEYSRF